MISESRTGGPTRRQWIVLCCVFLLSLPAVTARLYSSDEIQYFAYLRSLWFDRDLSFDNEYRYFYDRGVARSDGFHETFLERQTQAGRRINFGTLGCAVLWAPFYAVGDAAARVTGAPADGFSKPYIAAVAYASACYGFAAVVLGILCARRLGLNALAAGVAIWVGSPLLFYMYVAPPFSHGCSAFAVALFVYVWLRVREQWSVRGTIALGAAGALMAMVREQDVFFAVPAGIDFLLSSRRHLGAAVAGVVAFAACYLPQALAYLRINGHLGPDASVANKMNWRGTHSVQVLLSPEHGFFGWTPLALIAIGGLVALVFLPPEGGSHARGSHASGSHTSGPSKRRGFRLQAEEPLGRQAEGPLRRQAEEPLARQAEDPRGLQAEDPRGHQAEGPRRVAVLMLLMVALQVYIGGSVESWTVAGGYGQRRFIALSVLLIVGLAAAGAMLRHSRAAHRLFVAACLVTVYWNVALIVEFGTGLMDRQRLEPRANAYNAFVTLPREAPSLAYRYLFDRSSFYKPKVSGINGASNTP